MIQDNSDSPAKYYGWDAEGKMKWVSSTPGSGDCPTDAIACYKYNALGQLVELNWKTQNRLRNFVYSPFGEELGQYTSGGYTAWDDQYVPLGGRHIAKYYGCCDTAFLHPNAIGSTTMVTNQLGNTTRDEVFYPYGQLQSAIGSNWDTRFAAFQQREFASGLDPTPNRMFHSRLYRWMTPDPLAGSVLNPQSLNRYAYVMNNPTNLNDPLGLGCESQTSVSYDVCMAHYAGNSFDGFYAEAVGNGSTCYIDGAPGSCTQAQATVASGAARYCPGGACNGMLSGPNGVWLPVHYNAGGYYNCSLAGLHDSADTAGIAAVGCSQAMANALGKEVGGNIFKSGGQYSFTNPVVGTPTTVYIPGTVPNGTTLAADYHIHVLVPGDWDYERFSRDMDIYDNDLRNHPGYLGTPGGRVEVYNPSSSSEYPRGCVLVGSPVPAGSPNAFSPSVPMCR